MKDCTKRFVGKPGGPADAPMDEQQAERHCALYFEALGVKEEQVGGEFHASAALSSLVFKCLSHAFGVNASGFLSC